jgi:hypothetical protein
MTRTERPMTTAEMVQLVDDFGIVGLRRELGCTMRQAETTAILARRALRDGYELTAEEIPKGTAAMGQGRARRKQPTGATEATE